MACRKAHDSPLPGLFGALVFRWMSSRRLPGYFVQRGPALRASSHDPCPGVLGRQRKQSWDWGLRDVWWRRGLALPLYLCTVHALRYHRSGGRPTSVRPGICLPIRSLLLYVGAFPIQRHLRMVGWLRTQLAPALLLEPKVQGWSSIWDRWGRGGEVALDDAATLQQPGGTRRSEREPLGRTKASTSQIFASNQLMAPLYHARSTPIVLVAHMVSVSQTY